MAPQNCTPKLKNRKNTYARNLFQEAKPYKNDTEIMAMTNLVTAYQNNDINEFELILKHNRQTIMEDLFIREHIEDLLRNIRTQVRLNS